MKKHTGTGRKSTGAEQYEKHRNRAIRKAQEQSNTKSTGTEQYGKAQEQNNTEKHRYRAIRKRYGRFSEQVRGFRIPAHLRSVTVFPDVLCYYDYVIISGTASGVFVDQGL